MQEERNKVLGIARLLTRSPELAEDAVQEAYLSMLEAEAKGEVIRNRLAFLKTAVRHKVVDMQRKEGRETYLSHELADHGGAEQRFLVHELMQRLTPRQQQAWRLVMIGGHSNAEAAERMGVSERSVSRLIARAFNRIEGS